MSAPFRTDKSLLQKKKKKAVLFPVFLGISTLFSIVAVLVCIPTNSSGPPEVMTLDTFVLT